MSVLKKCCLSQSRPTRSRIIIAAALIALVLLFSFPSAKAAPEPPSVEWSRTYEGLGANSIIQTLDGGYAVAGIAWSSDVATFVKLDSSGNVQWQKTYGNAVSVAQTSDSGYVLFTENGYVVKTNVEGDLLSSFSVGLTGVRQGILTNDGNYVLVGNSLGDDGETFAWLYRVDGQGNIIWDKKFTGGFVVFAVVETDDRGCALAGNWKKDFWLAKIDSNGNQQWSQIYSYGDLLDAHFTYSMAKTKDGGFVLAGAGDWQSSGGLVPWLIKIDSQGHERWNQPYGQYPHDSFTPIVQTADEGYLVAQGGTATLIRTDSSGSELWKVPLDIPGGWAPNSPSSSLIRTKDGGYVIAGATLGNAFVIKFSPEADTQPPVVVVSSPKGTTYEPNDISLIFTVNEPASRISYSLDGQTEVTIASNTTLSGLTVGTHNLTVYAQDSGGLVGASETIQFSIVARFPTELVITSIAIAAVVSLGFLIYFKRHSLSAYRKKGLSYYFQKQRFVALVNNRMIWTLTIISISILLVFVQIFFPYFYYSSSSGNSKSTFEVGISYVYEQDNIGQIDNEVLHIKDLGFNVIRVNMVCDSTNPIAYSNTLTDVFFSAIRQINIRVALIINNHDSSDDINYYLGKWSRDLAYVQVLNEPDVASSWDMGALFTDDEAGSRFEEVYAIVEQHQLSAQLYTNFGPAFLIRTNLPVQFSEKLDFVGFDVFMESFLTLSPRMIQLLQKITNKEIVIAEFGMSTSDDTAQSDYIIKGLNLFKSMGLRGCWIVYWNSIDNIYGIRGRLAEQKVGEWIAQNS